MREVRGRAEPQGSIIRSLTLHFCKRLFPRLEPVTAWSHGNNFTSYAKRLNQLHISDPGGSCVVPLVRVPQNGMHLSAMQLVKGFKKGEPTFLATLTGIVVSSLEAVAFSPSKILDQVSTFEVCTRNVVQHLVLQFPKDNLYKLPSSFFTCFQIRHLSLHKCLINPPPAFKGFDKLVALELCEVTISSKFLGSLISYSLLLEQLVLQSSISDHIQIKAPKLRSFDFTGSLKLISLMDVPLLAKLSLVDIDEGGSYDTAKFFESFPALEHLHLNCYSVQFLAGKVPKQLLSPLNCLKRLYLSDICLDGVDEASCVLCLIRSSPYLQDIEIQLYDSASGYDYVMEEIAGLESREVESFSDVTLNHLRSVKLTGIIGLTPEMELIQLLLAKSPMPIKMLIEPGVGDNSPETRLKVLAEITKFQRASSKAKVVYKVA